MTVELNKSDLVSLVRGTSPNYQLFNHSLVNLCGSYTGGHKDEWNWNNNLYDLTEEQLWDLYVLCKDSWSKQ